jgi:methyltransferase (TIGR00027 family)
MTTAAIRNVSGTAFWIAHFRAMEGARAEPLFEDPWASALAGERGREIMTQLRGSERIAWMLAIRTHAIDQLILRGIARDGFDTVLSLGAGLDTRAFRLALPAKLHWIEADMPEIVAHKREVLAGVAPRCAWTPISADLGATDVRQRVLAEAAVGARRMLVLTEGILEYLTDDAVRQLAFELAGHAACHTWIMNLYSQAALKPSKRWQELLARENARVRFTPAEGAAFFDGSGWREAEWVSMLAQARELGRIGGLAKLAVDSFVRLAPQRQRERILRAAGVARLQRVGQQSSASEVHGDVHHGEGFQCTKE